MPRTRPPAFARPWFVAALGAAAWLLGVSGTARAEGVPWRTDFDAASTDPAAAAGPSDTLLLFTGSDWCPPCIKLEEGVFSDPVAGAAIAAAFVPVMLDFRRADPPPPAEVARNEALMARYAPQPAFPTLVLVDPEGRPYAATGYEAEIVERGPMAYVEHLLALQGVRERRDAALAEAKTLDGLEKAKALDAAVGEIDAALVAKHYADVVDQILELDPDDTAGLKAKYESARAEQELQAAIPGIVRGMQEGRLDEGIAVVDGLIEKYDPSGEALMTLELIKGQAYGLQQNADAAAAAFDRALAADPQNPGADEIRAMKARFTRE